MRKFRKKNFLYYTLKKLIRKVWKVDYMKNIEFGYKEEYMQFINSDYRKDYDPNKRIVKQDKIKICNDEYFISTIDLGVNFSCIKGRVEYFETMIFRNNYYDRAIYLKRYATRKEALKNHNLLVDNLKCFYDL